MELNINEIKVLNSLQHKCFGIKIDECNMTIEVISIKTHLDICNVRYCVKSLLNSEYIQIDTLKKNLLKESTVYYKLTEKGKTYLDNIRYQKKSKLFWSIVVPLVISIVGTILTNKLFPK